MCCNISLYLLCAFPECACLTTTCALCVGGATDFQVAGGERAWPGGAAQDRRGGRDCQHLVTVARRGLPARRLQHAAQHRWLRINSRVNGAAGSVSCASAFRFSWSCQIINLYDLLNLRDAGYVHARYGRRDAQHVVRHVGLQP